MRVTETLRFDSVSQRLATLRDQYQQTALQATSGKRVNAPSDDPVAAAEAARVDASLAQSDGNQRSIDLVRGDVQLAEASLEQAGDLLQRARELAMAGASDSSGGSQRSDLAVEARQCVNQLIEIANVKGTQGFLFSGTATNVAALDGDGNFQGNDASHVVQTGAGQPIAVNVSGAQAFTAAGGRDVVQDLRDLATGLESNDVTAIRATLDNLQLSHDQIQRERSHAGLIINRLDLSENIVNQADLNLSQREAAVLNTDTAKTYTQLTQLEGAINSSVTVGKRLLEIGSIQRF
jgi:flagellar hook-associated protein 3 FlgL